MLDMRYAPMHQIVALWVAAAKMPPGMMRNLAYWACVHTLEARGFAGNARRLLERRAAWSTFSGVNE